jgi:hypothetical protein
MVSVVRYRYVVGPILVLLSGSVAVAVTHGSSLTPSARGTDGHAVRVLSRLGQVGPVHIGDRPRAFDTAFGSRRPAPSGGDTTWWTLGTPGTYHYPKACTGPRRATGQRTSQVTTIVYRGAQVSFCGGRSFLIVTTARGSRTGAGASIGEPLRQAAARHHGMRCDTSTASTTDPPSPVYRYCTVRIAPGRDLWLGQDPVSSIALATVPLA